MQFRSFRRRGLGAFASTALVAGALAVPTLLAAPAQATTTDDVSFTCTGFGGFTYTTDITLTAEWSKATGRAALSAELDDFPNGAPAFVTADDQAQSAKLVTKVDGATTATTLTGSTVADFKGGVPIVVPTLAAAVGAKAETLSVVVESFELTAGTSVFACSLAEPLAAMVVPITFPDGSDLNYVCAFGANKFGYLTDATVTAEGRGPNVRTKIQLENMPNTAPVFVSLPNQAHTATLAMTVNGGSSVNAVGTSTANFQGGVPVVIPQMSVDVASAADTVAVTASDFSLAVGTGTNIACDLAAPAELAAVDVTDAVPTATTTAVAATSATPNAVSLAATVTPTGAVGKVEFYEGAAKVGEAAVAAGKAGANLTAVAAGAHTYTAKFVPTEAWAFAASTATAATVTVKAPVVTPPGPSAACVDAKAAHTKAQGAVTKAAAASKKAKAAATKAQAAVKKLTKAKAPKAKIKAAKAKLAKAKANATKAAKQVKLAQKVLDGAKAAETAAC